MDRRLRQRCIVTGRVQGVGFRPFVHRLAIRLGLGGSVRNAHAGVVIEIEGGRGALDLFAEHLVSEHPLGSMIETIEREFVPSHGEKAFVIDASTSELFDRTTVPVDTAPCAACLFELNDPGSRRYQYPFISCASCGPRFSILKRAPFDRENTSLDAFPLCEACLEEYSNPQDRRFHAQTIGCPTCGPTVELTDNRGHPISVGYEAIVDAAVAIGAGERMAVKGVGGFHLLVDAQSDEGVRALREGKQRGNKPFGVLYETIDDVVDDCVLSEEERQLILDNRAPMVFLERRKETRLSELVAPGSPYVGAMLPCSPLHHLLMKRLGRPVVATSGNLAGEPVCCENDEALRQLGGLTSLFLMHNRPIIHPCDDSIWQIVGGREFPRRLGRGYAPSAVSRGTGSSDEVVAIGGITKSAVAVQTQYGVVVGPYSGSPHSFSVMQRHDATIALLSASERKGVTRMVYDLHPDWLYPRGNERTNLRVQHHVAHAWSAIVDADVSLPVCAVVWDGAGYGPDGTIWGGEWLLITEEGFERRFALKPFLLLGGDHAARLPERSAAALWFGAFGEKARTSPVWERLRERDTLWRMIETMVGCTPTTSMGRLFDGIASAVGLCHVNTYEGEAAIRLEAAARNGEGTEYPIAIGDALLIDWTPLIAEVEADLCQGLPSASIAHRFHQTLLFLIGRTAEQIGIPHVVLTGGCFQNTLLLEGAILTLRQRGFHPHWHHRIPCHDEGLSVGQLAAATKARSTEMTGRGLCVSPHRELSFTSPTTIRSAGPQQYRLGRSNGL